MVEGTVRVNDLTLSAGEAAVTQDLAGISIDGGSTCVLAWPAREALAQAA